MDTFRGKVAVITGGGAGMGAELAVQLAAEGCHVAICDVSESNLAETQAACRKVADDEIRVTTFVADVSRESDLVRFAEAVKSEHNTRSIDLLFNNAGIGGGGYSFVRDPREQWERVFNVNWGGVYLGVRTFLPLLLESSDARIINTSSVNGLWAGLSKSESLVAYSTAKFAVRGFSEALVMDLKLRAPHVGVSVVFPGYIGTSLVRNSMAYLGSEFAADAPDEGVADIDVSFRENAPMSAADAARVILEGVRERRWRILVGDDALFLDDLIRAKPSAAYDDAFLDELQAHGFFASMPDPPAAVGS